MCNGLFLGGAAVGMFFSELGCTGFSITLLFREAQKPLQGWVVLKEKKLCPGKTHTLSGEMRTTTFSFELDKQLAWLVFPCVPGGGGTGRNRWAVSIAQDGALAVHCSAGLCPLRKDTSAALCDINLFPLGWEWGRQRGVL